MLPVNVNGIVLDKNQLQKYLENLASEHILCSKSNKETYPIPRLKDNFNYITKTYDILNVNIKTGIQIHPAGEWILDNYYIIEETVKGIIKELPLNKYKNFIGIANGEYKGYARIYCLAAEIILYTDGKLELENIKELLKSYQNKKTLNMEEIWDINLFFKIVLIEKIRRICESIYSAQMQKLKVESLVERFLEKKPKEDQKFKIIYDAKNVDIGGNRYQFIEYLSYKLKKYGRQGIPYLNILEEEVKKQGLTVEEVSKKEHYDIAIKKVSLGNSIKSIHELQRMNFVKVFESINGVEEILKQDPVNVYDNMDYTTKEYYRNKVKEISRKVKLSEIYISQKALELASNVYEQEGRVKRAHIGYYLIDDGIKELYDVLQITHKKNTNKVGLYISVISIISIILAIILSGIVGAHSVRPPIQQIIILAIEFILIFIPITEAVIKIIQTILNKTVKPKLIPKMDFSKGIPEEDATMVVIPTVLDSGEKTKELLEKLEIYYLANKSENIYFTLLGDCTTSKNKKEPYDEKIIENAEITLKELNDKYKKEGLPIFNFIYRNRQWNGKQEHFLGWERKRGLLNQFNEYLLGNLNNVFRVNTINDWNIKRGNKLPKIKYIITLDADTNLVLNSGIQLVSAMAHILNIPELDGEKRRIVSGHALMQPRVGIDLVSSKKSKFVEIFAGMGGIDSYTNAISDIYQDNFDEGIFTGKGIYDLEIFSTIMKNQIPENTVLSHDLLEGNYLRCALVSDILLLDGYPSSFNTFMTRLERWIRGDWQIIRWIKNPRMNLLSKFKIIDNLRRSLLEITAFVNIIVLLCLKIFIGAKIGIALTVSILSVIMPTVLDYINYIVFKQEGIKKQKSFSKSVGGLQASFLRAVIEFSVLPYKAYMSLKAIIKTIYRMSVTHKYLLEWTTSEQAEKQAKNGIKNYYLNMWINVILGILMIAIGILYLPGSIILGVIWLIAPAICCYISKENVIEAPLIKLNQDEKEYLKRIGKDTWEYFNQYINKENNYLPPDNYQEDRKEKVVYRTSSTNIALGLLAVISAYDLKYIDLESTITKLEIMIGVISKLSKWNGHLYNWYNTKTLEPLIPRYISTVDSGNFIGFLYTVKQFLKEKEYTQYKDRVKFLIQEVDRIIDNTDFSVLYDEEKMLLSIGFNIEDNKLTDSYYDLLASEARQASFVAIAKRDIPEKHWSSLSRTLTEMNNYKGLISWSGTAFEYLMPHINIAKYPGSLIDESCKFMVKSQQEYTNKLGIPWGISESAFNMKDLNNNYQYKAFGIPWLGLKRGLADEMVVSTYGSILAINDYPREVLTNIKKLEAQEMLGKYGFYESIDYTPERLNKNSKNVPVKTYMAHHQGLILLSINNLFNNNILQKRFMSNPEIKAIDVLLQERMPENMLITKERKEKIEKMKYTGYDNYEENVYTKINENLVPANIIANENYSVVINAKGEGYSTYKNIAINRFKETNDKKGGIYFYIKNIRTKKIWKANVDGFTIQPDKYSISFAPDRNKLIRNDENIETTQDIVVAQSTGTEIRKITLKNNSNIDETIEISSIFEPILSTKEQDYSHRAFNNLGLRYEYLEDTEAILIKRNKRDNEEEIYVGTYFYTEAENTVGELEYEVNGNTVDKCVENSIPFSKKMTRQVEPVIAFRRTIKIPKNDKVSLNFVITASENKDEVLENLEYYLNKENINREYELSRVRVEEEAKYLRVNSKNLKDYQRMLPYIIFQNPMKRLYMNKLSKTRHSQEELWKYGISGDLPIVLVRIKNIDNISVIREILKAYEFFRTRNVKFDLIILDEEKNSYEKYLKEAIFKEVANTQLSYLLNSGIFIIDDKEDLELFLLRANFIIEANKGSIRNVLNELEEDFSYSIKNIAGDKKENIIKPEIENINNYFNVKNLKYYNEYGGFSEDGNEYRIRQNINMPIPTVWSHVMANEKFGTLVTNNMGGFTWSKNSRLNRITAWSNNGITDEPSEIIYIKDKELAESWSVGKTPKPDENEYSVIYGFGYAKYYHSNCGITQEVEVFVPTKDSVKVNILNLKNTTQDKKNLSVIYYIKPTLGEDEIKSNGYINLDFNKNSNLISAENLYEKEISKIAFVSCSEPINSYTGNKVSFIGNGNIETPEGLDKISLTNENSLGNNSCIAIQMDITIYPYENKEISLIIGEEENSLEVQDLAYKYSDIKKCKKELLEVKEFWKEKLSRLQVKTPSESMDIMLNGWLLYQTIVCRLWGKSAFYQSGGAIGFRDQLQDTLGLKYISPEVTRNQIIKQCAHQFIEGDVEHWWHEETKKGIRTRFSDDLLWLPYAVAEYIKTTGDTEILKEQVEYVSGDLLKDGENEIYDLHLPSDIKESVFEHCVKAIEKSLNFGENGLPKIGSGDWNDGFSKVGVQGKGESVWLGFFLYTVLDRFIDIMKNLENKDVEEKIQKYEEIKQELKKALNTEGWDGRWYKRAFMDDGNVLGTIENEECRIDSIAQSWSVISNAGDNDKKYISMESLENHLVDRETGIIKLLDPPFDKSNLEPGYIKMYLPGVRENGGQYTHAAIWAIIAEAILGFGNKAYEHYRMINPIEHAKTKDEANKYKVEPYVIAADVYGGTDLLGRGGWTWYTGSSSWYYRAGIEYILGLKIEEGKLKVEPCIPSDWREYSIQYKYKNTIYNINVKNLNGKNTGVEKIFVNGKELQEVELVDDGQIHEIEVLM